MKAVVIEEFGNPEVFQLKQLPKPQCLPGHVIVEVAASSVNPVDCKIRQGKLAAIAPAFPAILHGDVAGVVTEVGDGVADFALGDEVYACAGGVKGCGGALADYMLVDAALVAHKPTSLSLQQAAALPLVSITAWDALMHKAKLQPGQTVLIHGATGGVSHVAIQLAKAAGAKVYATCSSSNKAEIAKNLGADVAINYNDMTVDQYVEEFTNGRGFDVVFDTVGGANLQTSFAAAALNGAVVSVSTRCQQDLSVMHAKALTLHVVFMLIPLLYNIGRNFHGDILRQLALLVDDNKVKPLIDPQVFSIDDVALAHGYLESGKAIGKVVLNR